MRPFLSVPADDWTIAATDTGVVARYDGPGEVEASVGLERRFAPGARVWLPGSVYDGNRGECLPLDYPPMFPFERPEDGPPIVTDVPRLPRIELLSPDLAIPAVGVLEGDAGVWIVGPLGEPGAFTGFSVFEDPDGLTVRIQSPGVRSLRYHWGHADRPSPDRGRIVGTGETISLEVRVVPFSGGVSGMFDALLDLRAEGYAFAPELPFSAAYDLVADKFDRESWWEDGPFYVTAFEPDGTPQMQPGWVGGGLAGHAMLPRSPERTRRELRFLLGPTLAPSGLCHGIRRGDAWREDGFEEPIARNWLLTRKSADLLVFATRTLMRLDEPPAGTVEGLTRLAEGLDRLWRTHGQFGQFVDADTGRITVGGSASAASAPGGLALAARYLGRPDLLETAVRAGEKFAREDLARGVTTGGPGEILQGADSESVAGLLESFVILHDETGDPIWLDRATEAARQLASWVVAYDFPFPPDSEFGRLGMRSRGTVIANVQNKHSAPGICTWSPRAVFEVFRRTGDVRFFGLAREIAHSITQYVSREDRPIVACDGRTMPSGWVNERVNLSDWEEPGIGIGGVFWGPCWSEISTMLTALEMPSVWLSGGVARAVDHVTLSLEGGLLSLTNPTAFDAVYRIEGDAAASIAVAAGATARTGIAADSIL